MVCVSIRFATVVIVIKIIIVALLPALAVEAVAAHLLLFKAFTVEINMPIIKLLL